MGHLRGRRGALVAAGALFAAALLMHPGSSLGGQPHNDGPIVTSAGQAPWSVVLVANTSGGEQQCSGSLIDLTHVLTAAHCVFDDGTGQLIAPSGFVINAGIASELPASVAVNVGALEVLRVAAVRVMPGYVYASDTAGVANDVAELTLATPATPTSTVQPIAVAPVGASPQPGATTSVYGWGQSTTGISDQNEHLLTQTVLQPWTCDSGVSARICTVSATADSCPGDLRIGRCRRRCHSGARRCALQHHVPEPGREGGVHGQRYDGLHGCHHGGCVAVASRRRFRCSRASGTNVHGIHLRSCTGRRHGDLYSTTVVVCGQRRLRLRR